MLQIGQPAPGFSLPDADMEMVRLSAFKGRKNVVLYFYPRDDTPCCTMESIDFSDLEEGFIRHHTVVLGVSRDDCLRHAAFRDKHGLSVRLLSDADGRVSAKYGVEQEKEVDGVKRMAVVHSTFIIDRHGVLRHALYGINPRGHATEVLNLIKLMG